VLNSILSEVEARTSYSVGDRGGHYRRIERTIFIDLRGINTRAVGCMQSSQLHAEQSVREGIEERI
jgi:hypothetical protein